MSLIRTLSDAMSGARGKQPASPPESMNLIQTPDIARKLVTRYGIREKSPAPTLAAEVVPVVLVDELVGESDLIRPRIRPATGAIVGTSAATVNWLHLWNPATSKTIVHLQYLIIRVSAATDNLVFHSWGTSAPPPGGQTTLKGFRNGLFGGESPVAQQFSDQATGPTGGVAISRLPIFTATLIIPFDHVMDEGNVLSLGASVVYTGTMTISWFWTEEAKER